MCHTQTLVPIPDDLLADIDFDATHPEFGLDGAGRQCFAIDSCIVAALLAVWAAGYKTLGCCCGHGQVAGGIITIDTSDAGRAYAGPRTPTQERYAEIHSSGRGPAATPPALGAGLQRFESSRPDQPNDGIPDDEIPF